MQLQYDTQEAVPEDLRESFVEFKEGDKTLFMHKDLAETKKEVYRFKGDLTHAQRLAQEKSERLQALELEEQQRQADLEARELESKKKNGQHEEILEHFKTQAQKEKEALQAKLDELSGSIKQKEKAAVVNDFSSIGTDSTRGILKRLIEQDLDFSEDGSLVVLEEGKATSVTLDEYKVKLKDLYPHLVSESHAKGGGRKGSLGSGGTGGVPATLEECKGDKALEAAYFNNQLLQGN
jgi:hypothetical protein